MVDCLPLTLYSFLPVEVALHTLLHARQIYPSALFLRRSKYCVAVQRAEHPGVISYITKVLDTCKSDLDKGTLVRLIWVAVSGKESLSHPEQGNAGTKGKGKQKQIHEANPIGGRRAIERWVFDFDDVLSMGKKGDEWTKTEP